MTIWIIEPRDPLIVRDGRPFGPNPGARATSLSFPFPSTTTGGVRTRAGLKNGVFDLTTDEQLNHLKQLNVRGPLLVQLTSGGDDIEQDKWLVPAPLDALLFPTDKTDSRGDRETLMRQLVPLALPEGAMTDLGGTNADNEKNLMLVGLPEPDPQKPLTGIPHYWYWETFQNWLLNPALYNGQTKSLSELGQSGPGREQRMHVSIDLDRAVAKDGMLFETSGLEFTTPGKNEQRLKDAQRLALAVAVDDNHDFSHRLQEGFASFGGERRIISWRKSNVVDLPACPTELEQTIAEKRFCRVFLLTPAYFREGYRPTELLADRNGVRPKLKAITIQRPQVVSGWDLALRKPKPTKRLAPAGTVLFLSLEESENEAAIKNWVRGMWMHCISDEPQSNIDGFGLAVVGTWSG